MSDIENIKQESDKLREKNQVLNHKLEDSRKRAQHLLGYKKQYDRIMLSRSWRLMLQLHQIRHRFIPLGSKREKVFQSFIGVTGTLLRKVNRNQVLQTGDSVIQRIGQRSYTYSDWINDFEPDAQTLEAQISNFDLLDYKPLISIVTPVYNPPKDVLRKTISSVLDQTYSNWELCLADASDTDDIQILIEEFATKDERINYRKLKENLGISGNSNQALELATGEFVALMDHDDFLAPNMLYELVCALNEEPDLDILYYDEDKVDESGKNRIQPFLKPDWSPEMFLSVNYLTHSVIRRSLINEVGNLDPHKDGSQDWDLLFRCTEKTDRIKHLPKILYHWRQVPGSTSGAYRAKSYVFDRQILSVEEHLQRIGVENPTAAFVRPGYLRTTWPVQGEKVSIIIPTKDNVKILQKCLTSILQITEYPDFEIILVDNNSSEPEVLSYYQKIQDDLRI